MRNLGTSKGASLHEKIKVIRTNVRKRQRRHGTERRRHEEKGLSGTKKEDRRNTGKEGEERKGGQKDNRTKGPNDQ